jgi:hypothetical protein
MSFSRKEARPASAELARGTHNLRTQSYSVNTFVALARVWTTLPSISQAAK